MNTDAHAELLLDQLLRAAVLALPPGATLVRQPCLELIADLVLAGTPEDRLRSAFLNRVAAEPQRYLRVPPKEPPPKRHRKRPSPSAPNRPALTSGQASAEATAIPVDPVPPGYRDKAQFQTQWGVRLYRSGDYDGAQQAFSAAIALWQQVLEAGDCDDPDAQCEWARAHCDLGLALLELDEPQKALECFQVFHQTVARLNALPEIHGRYLHDLWLSHIHLADAHERMGLRDEAIAAWREGAQVLATLNRQGHPIPPETLSTFESLRHRLRIISL